MSIIYRRNVASLADGLARRQLAVKGEVSHHQQHDAITSSVVDRDCRLRPLARPSVRPSVRQPLVAGRAGRSTRALVSVSPSIDRRRDTEALSYVAGISRKPHPTSDAHAA